MRSMRQGTPKGGVPVTRIGGAKVPIFRTSRQKIAYLTASDCENAARNPFIQGGVALGKDRDPAAAFYRRSGPTKFLDKGLFMSANQSGSDFHGAGMVEGGPKNPKADHRTEADGKKDAAADLQGVISQLSDAAEGAERVSLGDLVDAMGRSSMAAVLLVPALLLISPISGVPGASVVGGIVIALISAQILLRREKVWLPEFIRNRTLPGSTLRKGLEWLRKPARRFDGLAPARPEGGKHAWWMPVLAAMCLLLGLGMPMLELIPFSSSIVATLIAALALTMLTGRLTIAMVAIVLASAAIYAVVWLI